METLAAGEVVRLSVEIVVDELVVDGLQVELDATFNGCIDEHVEDAESKVSVVARTHERRRHRVGVTK